MATLNIASKANQAITFPALLVASFVNDSDSDTQISVNFDEVDVLNTQDKEVVELSLGANESTYGSQEVIGKMLDSYPSIQIKNQDYVQTCAVQMSSSSVLTLQ